MRPAGPFTALQKREEAQGKKPRGSSTALQKREEAQGKRPIGSFTGLQKREKDHLQPKGSKNPSKIDTYRETAI